MLSRFFRLGGAELSGATPGESPTVGQAVELVRRLAWKVNGLARNAQPPALSSPRAGATVIGKQELERRSSLMGFTPSQRGAAELRALQRTFPGFFQEMSHRKVAFLCLIKCALD